MLKTIRQQTHATTDSQIANTIDVVCAADDAYAMPLAVTLKSLCQNVGDGISIRLFLLDGGINEENWQRLKETLACENIDVVPIHPDAKTFSDLSISHHISHTAYFRLLAAELLPDDVDKAIYLDSDLLIRDDIQELWRQPLNDNFCLATVDIACPYIDARLGCPNFRLANPYMAVFRPVRNYKQLGMDGSHEYFNSGVLVMNLAKWRRENVAEKLLRTLRDNPKFVWCWDQYALNVVFHGQWGRFLPRWNQGAHVFEYPSANYAPIDPQQWMEMKTDPAIVHFTTEHKPWQHNSNHPRGEMFYDGLDETAWKGWNPKRSQLNFRRRLDLVSAAFYKRAAISSRKVASIWARERTGHPWM